MFDEFQKFYSFVLAQFNVGIKCLQTDGGKEYMSTRFDDFFENQRSNSYNFLFIYSAKWNY